MSSCNIFHMPGGFETARHSDYGMRATAEPTLAAHRESSSIAQLISNLSQQLFDFVFLLAR